MGGAATGQGPQPPNDGDGLGYAINDMEPCGAILDPLPEDPQP
jgi:hypothetical protein